MKNLSIVVAAIVLVAIGTPRTSFAQKGLSLAETEKKFNQAMTGDSVEALSAFYAEDAVMMIERGPMLKGRQQIVQQFLLPASKAGVSMSSKTIDVAEGGDLGFSAGTAALKAPGAALRGKWVSVWKRVQGEWKIAYAIANSDPPPAK